MWTEVCLHICCNHSFLNLHFGKMCFYKKKKKRSVGPGPKCNYTAAAVFLHFTDSLKPTLYVF